MEGSEAIEFVVSDFLEIADFGTTDIHAYDWFLHISNGIVLDSGGRFGFVVWNRCRIFTKKVSCERNESKSLPKRNAFEFGDNERIKTVEKTTETAFRRLKTKQVIVSTLFSTAKPRVRSK